MELTKHSSQKESCRLQDITKPFIFKFGESEANVTLQANCCQILP